jgi:hypothetical protein
MLTGWCVLIIFDEYFKGVAMAEFNVLVGL